MNRRGFFAALGIGMAAFQSTPRAPLALDVVEDVIGDPEDLLITVETTTGPVAQPIRVQAVRTPDDGAAWRTVADWTLILHGPVAVTAIWCAAPVAVARFLGPTRRPMPIGQPLPVSAGPGSTITITLPAVVFRVR